MRKTLSLTESFQVKLFQFDCIFWALHAPQPPEVDVKLAVPAFA
jgi:hypothetical protein